MLRTAACSALAAFATANFNEDHADLIHGRKELLSGEMETIWTQYVAEYGSLSPVDLNEQDSMVNFFEKLDSII